MVVKIGENGLGLDLKFTAHAGGDILQTMFGARNDNTRFNRRFFIAKMKKKEGRGKEWVLHEVFGEVPNTEFKPLYTAKKAGDCMSRVYDLLLA